MCANVYVQVCVCAKLGPKFQVVAIARYPCKIDNHFCACPKNWALYISLKRINKQEIDRKENSSQLTTNSHTLYAGLVLV